MTENKQNKIINIAHLSKKYGDFVAVNDVSFYVEQGETFGILGPNGAGKTTTLEMIEGLKSISNGEISLDGHDVEKEKRIVKSLIGVQLQSSSFFDGLNLVELLETFAALYGREVDAKKILGDVQLVEKSKNMVKELSGGQKQRLSIAVALVNDPKVIFLDEPTTGLDPQARHNLWSLITEIKKQGKTIVLTTHYMDEAEVLCDRIAIMDNAKIVALDTTSNLLKNADVFTAIEFGTTKVCPEQHYKDLPGVTKVSNFDHRYRIETGSAEQTLPALFQHSHQCGPILDLQLHQPTLEDVFLKLTGHKLRE
jgi:ABC-2 type transport system ATP-binding protein